MSHTPPPARVREVLDLALERPAQEREAYIAGVCGDDSRLRNEVASLMQALDAGGEALEPPAAAPPPPAEPLTGLRFGAYRVAERVGEGGMGVVYRAEDTRLGRAVAVKALPPTLARDPHRRARFEHEARILASLNHPNIAGIHGVEETARGPVLVLEFIPGRTLAERLKGGAMALDEALSVAAQVARGLEAAHTAGVVHRDLKPSNIQLTPDGMVKILDFGVAKQAAASPQPDASATMPGSLIGTAAYMSPEQARGRPVDRRTDLWAFGCVLFEMLTGARAFEGSTSSDTLAAVLRAEPDWARVPPATPPAVDRLLRRCLEKDPDRRQRDAGDARLDLEGPGVAQAPGTRRTRRATNLAVVALASLAIGVLAGALWPRHRNGPPSVPAPVRFELNLDPAAAVSVTQGGAMAISPEGGTLVFAGGPADRPRLFARRLDSRDTVELSGTDDAAEPCFSPDGRWIAFRTGEQIRRVPAAGGGAEVLVRGGVAASGLAWGADGIVYIATSPPGLHRVLPSGQTETVVQFGSPDGTAHMHPEPLPGGDTFLLTIVRQLEAGAPASVEAVRAGSGERRLVIPDASGARFLPPSRLVFWQAGALRSAPFDPATLRLIDAPTVAVQPLAGGEILQPPRFAVSPAGVLATLPGNIRYESTRLCWYEPDGSWTEVARAGPAIDAPRLSPDGTRIAMLIGLASGDLWIQDLRRSALLRLTTGDCRHHPVWAPDGRRVVFGTRMPGEAARVEWIVADGSAPAEVLWQAPMEVSVYPTDFAADGRLLLTLGLPGAEHLDLFEFDPQTREAPRRIMTPGNRYGARLSPKGDLIAYTSEETGTTEVYLHRFPSLENKLRVSASGGYRPVWSGDGRKLFFRYVNRVMVVDVDAGAEVKVSPARTVAEHLPDARYDVDADGRRLLMARPHGDLGPQTRIDLVVGWDPAHP